MDLCYVFTHLVDWLIAGTSKFVINTLKAKQLAFSQIGYGGLPSCLLYTSPSPRD